MLIILPLASFGLLWVSLAARGIGSKDVEVDAWQPAFLAAAALWGGFLTLTTEALSLPHLLTRAGLATVWGLAAAAAGYYAWRTGALHRTIEGFSGCRQLSLRRPGLTKWFGAGLLLGTLLLLAWFSPPNNTDSLLYHMSRVAHWQQNASLAHYPASYNHQLWTQIWSESAILHLKILLGSDQASALVQWFSMLGTVLGASAIASLLGSRRRGQWLAAAFVFSLPIGILESTSTQNDYVAAFWLVVFAYFVVLSKRRNLMRLEWLAMATALGLGVLTKATDYIFMFPFAAWLLLPRFIRGSRLEAIRSAVGMLTTMAILNLGYWWRNVITFGGPLGFTPVSGSGATSRWPGQLLIGPMRQLLKNSATPSESLTGSIVSLEHVLEGKLGVPNSPFSLIWAWNNEDIAGNPVHVLMIGLALAGILWLWRRRVIQPKDSPALNYTSICLASVALFAWLAGYATYGVRYQIPAFVIFGAVVGWVGERVLGRNMAGVLFWSLFALSIPFVLFNQSRALISWRPRTRVDSVLTTSRRRILFANWPEYMEPYTEAADLIKGSSCQQIGLVIDSHDKEYLIWSVLGAPENGMHLEVLDPLSASSRYLDPSFEPCAVFCTMCGPGRTDWEGIPLVGEFEGVQVYIR